MDFLYACVTIVQYTCTVFCVHLLENSREGKGYEISVIQFQIPEQKHKMEAVMKVQGQIPVLCVFILLGLL